MGAADGLERVLIAIAARCLRLSVHEIDPAAPLTRYGLDSLTALELAEAVAIQTGLELSEEAFMDAPSIQALALRLLLQHPVATGAEQRTDRMRADAVLDIEISARGLPPASPGTFLLTGANGFLGTHILQELLATGAREVVCLVRAPNDTAAADRLARALTDYGVTLPAGRVRVLAADIAAPSFGLAPVAYAELTRSGGTIVHCAAEVNWAASYETLRAVNVEATRALLRFACTSVAKPFHFVSSVAAGYSTLATSPYDEEAPPAEPSGLHLGYAQGKWAAERLVEAARERGLPATIHRPSLIAGHSGGGRGNDDDLFSRMLRGCVELGYAPELDWPLDACPVDFVARAVALVAASAKPLPRVLHLRNPHPACWTEAVLWMNLRGYVVRLEPYAAWAERVRRDTSADHPLHALRAFLLHQPPEEGGRYLPELYARPHVRALQAEKSLAALAQRGASCPRLGARLLERYFERWTACGLVPRSAHVVPAAGHEQDEVGERLTRVLRRYFGDDELRIEAAHVAEFGADHSLIGELGSWRADSRHAMQSCGVDLARGDGRPAHLDLVLKTKLPDAAVLDVAGEVAALCDPGLGRAFAAYRDRSEFSGARARECGLYASASGALRAHIPVCFGTMADGESSVLVLERVSGTELANAVDDPLRWTPSCIQAALTGIASIHAQWFGREPVLASEALRAAPGADADVLAWWDALGGHAAPWLHAWLGTAGVDMHKRSVERFPAACRWTARQPHSLIHGDFNPRNLALRRTALGPRLCAFDWELAGIGLPQRDIVELLCFVLDPEQAAREAPRYLELSRLALQRAARRDIAAAWWHAGVRAALADFGVTRLPMYFLAHRFRPQGFLQRVARCWWRLASILGTEP